jgi:protease-4
MGIFVVIKNCIMTFLRNFFASCLGTLVAFGIAFFMIFVLISTLSDIESSTTIGDKVVLELDFQGYVKDRVADAAQDPFSAFADPSIGLDQMLLAIKVAKEDSRVKGISIRNPYFMGGFSQIYSIREALSDFKTSGKKIFSYSDIYDQKDYFLASVADSVFLSPTGILEFKGLSTEVLYLKDFQDKSGLKMEVIRHGKYKSAVEPYLANEMSDAQKTQLSELLGGIWNEIAVEMAESRHMTLEKLNELATEMGGRTASLALKNGLIDGLLYVDDYELVLKKAFDLPLPTKPKTVSLKDYMDYATTKRPYSSKENIAVVYAQGEILYGKGNADYIGQELTIEGIEAAASNSSVKAIVLRVNSPGGSALVSDLIWNAVENAKKMKPVVVSMGDVAASGGYYIAAGANKIFATPTTITGSIGVFGILPNVSGLATEWGVNAQQISTHDNGANYSVFIPMTEKFRALTTESIEDTYQTFLSRVSAGRGISMATVDSLAQGRVWTAKAALAGGLIDGIGDLDIAIAAAAELGNTTEYGIRNYPKYKSPLEQFIEDFGGVSTRVNAFLSTPNPTNDAAGFMRHMTQKMSREGIQTRMPFVLEVQ